MKETIQFNDQFIETFDFLENSNQNIFVTGVAGTGKSTLLEYFRDNTLKNVAVLAPTGVSAVNIKGQTIHSFFRFKPDITIDGIHSIRIPKARKRIYEKLDTLVIDEISMVRSDLLDCINEFLKIYGRRPDLPFGGIQMIFFGDLYQLPPVVTSFEKDLFADLYQSPYFFDAHSFKQLKLEYVALTTIYRQKDKEFIDILNAVRHKTLNTDSLSKLNERCLPDYEPKEEEFTIYLTTTNDLSHQINQSRLKKLNSDIYTFEGEVAGDFKLKNLPTLYDLKLKVDAQVMLLNNDPMGRWVNGSIGKVLSLRTSDNDEETDSIKVELSEGKVVSVKPFTWEMYKFYFNEKTERLDSEVVGSFTQYPLRLAWAITIHKSQGKTFSKIILDIGSGTFAHGQLYVALSRCTTLEGLTLKRPLLKRHMLLDQRIVAFMEKDPSESLTSD